MNRENTESIKAVQMMQDYISAHFRDEDFSLEKVCTASGYSRRHADRLFKSHLEISLKDYIHSVCLTQSIKELSEGNTSILEIALNSHFQTHEGFTRSFRRKFHVTPSKYRDTQIPVPLFTQYPIEHYYALLDYEKHKEEERMNQEINLCMVTAKERPKRKLIYLPSAKAVDYFSYCEEKGCDWEGLLNSIPEKFESAALIELPDFAVPEGCSKTAAGIEVPLDYDKPLPDGYLTVDLQECVMLYFQSEPYEDENDFCAAIDSTYAAIEKYQPEVYGYRFAYDIAPGFNLGAEAATGARLAVPAVKSN